VVIGVRALLIRAASRGLVRFWVFNGLGLVESGFAGLCGVEKHNRFEFALERERGPNSLFPRKAENCLRPLSTDVFPGRAVRALRALPTLSEHRVLF
jgi:hypothetical protein